MYLELFPVIQSKKEEMCHICAIMQHPKKIQNMF